MNSSHQSPSLFRTSQMQNNKAHREQCGSCCMAKNQQCLPENGPLVLWEVIHPIGLICP